MPRPSRPPRSATRPRVRSRHAPARRATARADAGQAVRRPARRATAGCSSRSGTASGRSSSGTVTRCSSSRATSSRSTATSRSWPSRCAAALPERCVVDGEVVIAGPDGHLDFDALLLRIHPAESRVRMLAAESPASFVAWDLLALGDEDLRAVAPGRAAGPARGGPGGGRATGPPDPGDPRPGPGRGLVPPLRGRGARRGHRQAARRALPARASGRCSRSSTSARRTASSPGSAGTRTARARSSGRSCSGCSTTRARSTTSGSPPRSRWPAGPSWSSELAPLRMDVARRASLGRVGRVGGRGRGRRAAGPRRHLALEPRPRPVLGAAPGRAGRRGRLRPPPGRPLPPRDDVRPLAPRQAPGGLPLRPARGDGSLRAVGDLRA